MSANKGLLGLIPPGLLSLLDLKTRGKNPDTLLEVLTPTFDLTDWYGNLSPSINVAQVILPAGSASVYSNILLPTAGDSPVVPEGEIWRVRDYTVLIEGSAATAAPTVNDLRAVVDFRESAGGGFRHKLVGDGIGYVHGGGSTAGLVIPAPSLRDFWATAGARFMVFFYGEYVDAVNAGQITCTTRFDRLKI